MANHAEQVLVLRDELRKETAEKMKAIQAATEIAHLYKQYEAQIFQLKSDIDRQHLIINRYENVIDSLCPNPPRAHA